MTMRLLFLHTKLMTFGISHLHNVVVLLLIAMIIMLESAINFLRSSIQFVVLGSDHYLSGEAGVGLGGI